MGTPRIQGCANEEEVCPMTMATPSPTASVYAAVKRHEAPAAEDLARTAGAFVAQGSLIDGGLSLLGLRALAARTTALEFANVLHLMLASMHVERSGTLSPTGFVERQSHLMAAILETIRGHDQRNRLSPLEILLHADLLLRTGNARDWAAWSLRAVTEPAGHGLGGLARDALDLATPAALRQGGERRLANALSKGDRSPVSKARLVRRLWQASRTHWRSNS